MYPLIAVVSIAVVGQLSVPGDQELSLPQQKKWGEYYHDQAASYSILVDDQNSHPLKMRDEPVLLWSNPVRGKDTRGSVFVWTHDGRPEVVGTVFSYRAGPDVRQVKHSFHSLSMNALSGGRNGKDSWAINVPGINPKRIPDSPKPAVTRALRLVQMRNLAREFSATTTSTEGVRQELRLLPQPLFRNEGSTPDVVDGALFTFVIGTDPELMLVIETRGKDDNNAWHFGAGRFTDLALELTHKESVLWTYEKGLVEDQKNPYLSRHMEARSKDFPLSNDSKTEE